tara:strand:- start:378 stop:539 length:162 start_codon:yes stop_codon:yes gene_type:complete
MIGNIIVMLLLALLGGVCLIVIPAIVIKNGLSNMRFNRDDFVEIDGVLYRKEK